MTLPLPLDLPDPTPYVSVGDLVRETRRDASDNVGCVVWVDAPFKRLWVRWTAPGGNARCGHPWHEVTPTGRREPEPVLATYPEVRVARAIGQREARLLMNGDMPCADAIEWLAGGGYRTLAEAWPAVPHLDWRLWWLERKLERGDARRLALGLDLLALAQDMAGEALAADTTAHLAELRARVPLVLTPADVERAERAVAEQRAATGAPSLRVGAYPRPTYVAAIALAHIARGWDWDGVLFNLARFVIGLSEGEGETESRILELINKRFSEPPLPAAGASSEQMFQEDR